MMVVRALQSERTGRSFRLKNRLTDMAAVPYDGDFPARVTHSEFAEY